MRIPSSHPSSCPLCSFPHDDLPHLNFECPHLAYERIKLMNFIRTQHPTLIAYLNQPYSFSTYVLFRLSKILLTSYSHICLSYSLNTLVIDNKFILISLLQSKALVSTTIPDSDPGDFSFMLVGLILEKRLLGRKIPRLFSISYQYFISI